ncbi:MAG TPA: methyltransferase domain-containing protein [Nitrospirota bacterium]|nr:methyltransferase domain-containing protein [Nitrospirota bacterium]
MNKNIENENDTATAFMAWDNRWSTEQGRADWTAPEEDIVHIIPVLRKRDCSTLLDLGCGVGRHCLLFATQGFKVFGVDASPNACRLTKKTALETGLSVDIRHALMTELPFEDGSFDYVLAWNVIYHGTQDVVRRTLAEIRRILRPGGIFQGTMLSTRDRYYGSGQQIDANTFAANCADEEKRHPHFYCNGDELVSLLKDFHILSLLLCEQKSSRSYHWNFVAVKL